MSKEAMKLALEALENNKRTHYYCEDTWYSCPQHEGGCANDFAGDECNCGADKANAEIEKAITAIKEVLAQPEQPTTTENNGGKTGWPPGLLQDDSKGLSKWLSNQPDAKRRVREALAEQPAQQEPVAVWELQEDGWDTICDGDWLQTLPVGTKLYTTPPAQRKPLTDEQVNLFINGRGDEDDDDYVEPTGDGFGLTDADLVRLVRRVEAAHGIKENT